MRPYVKDLNHVVENGVVINGKLTCISFRVVIADTRSKVLTNIS